MHGANTPISWMSWLARRFVLLSALTLMFGSTTGCSFLDLWSAIALPPPNAVNAAQQGNVSIQVRSKLVFCAPVFTTYYECVFLITGVDGNKILPSLYLMDNSNTSNPLYSLLILQIPAGAASIQATYSSGGSPLPMVVQETSAIPVQPGVTMTAEAGTKFLILELPASENVSLPGGRPENGKLFDFNLTFADNLPTGTPLTIKAQYATKMAVNAHTFYAPLYPCTTEFNLLPALTIPNSSTPTNLTTAIGDLVKSGSVTACNHKAYNYTTVPPPDFSLFLPHVLR
jgi:hypothetical protein